ncbi:putative DNA-binding domain-containing protein [Endozoicomonas sp. SM1973]|uniref:DNA-binding domain-containing protein n=1 Tax=Spartinivicinus marinus TaxID=2994442 RepID=A0A853I347_9GAMM|nr:DNA-binding domain-containing protein [Spartinivicinus marinus]MCX4029179.1 DNA-binding domain-containing protein [Spartinivicinus marinus]NYZ65912.1 putative DNA-binding domain-containing protein [Spartinivicinus marinus]
MFMQQDTDLQAKYAASLHNVAQSIIEQQPATAIYSNNTLGIHVQSLKANFAVTHQLLGETTFIALAQVYSQHFPATHWDINLYGNQFADFIASQVNSAQATSLPWLSIASVASIEYSIVYAYYADDDDKKQGYQSLAGRIGAEFSNKAHKLLADHYPYCDFPSHWQPNKPVAIWREGIKIKLYQHSKITQKAEVINGQ